MDESFCWATRQDKWSPLVGPFLGNVDDIGGFGGNTGIQDAHNIAWKLSLVLRLQASPALLTTYHHERHAAGQSAIQQAYARWKALGLPVEQDILGSENALPLPTFEMGLRYNKSSAIQYLDEAREDMYEDPFWPTADPGSRAPHVWFRRGNVAKSLYNNFDLALFVLLCSERGTFWLKTVENLKKKLPIRASIVPLGEFFSKYKIRDSGAVLIRPDGVIAWKASNDSEVEMLGQIMRQILGLKAEGQVETQTTHFATAPEVTGLVDKMKIEEAKSARKPSGGSFLNRMSIIGLRKK